MCDLAVSCQLKILQQNRPGHVQVGILDQSDDGNREVIDLSFDPVEAAHHRIDLTEGNSTLRPLAARGRTRSFHGHDQTPGVLKADDDSIVQSPERHGNDVRDGIGKLTEGQRARPWNRGQPIPGLAV